MGSKEDKPLVVDPCPWCGKAEVQIFSTEECKEKTLVRVHWVFCRGCKCAGPNAGNPAEAVERWNKRVLVVS